MSDDRLVRAAQRVVIQASNLILDEDLDAAIESLDIALDEDRNGRTASDDRLVRIQAITDMLPLGQEATREIMGAALGQIIDVLMERDVRPASDDQRPLRPGACTLDGPADPPPCGEVCDTCPIPAGRTGDDQHV